MPSYILRPNGDSKADWTENPVGTATACLDDVVTEADTPSTAGDQVDSATDSQTCRVDCATFTIPTSETVVAVTVWGYMTTPAGRTCTLALLTTGVSSTTTVAANTAASWQSSVRVGSLTQAQVDALQIQFATGVGAGTVSAYAAFLRVITAVRSFSTSGVGR